MALLIFLVGILQASFYWILKPLIMLCTATVEFHWLGYALIFLIAWLISGKIEDQKS